MGDWDFLWGLKGKELEDAMSSGGTKEDWEFLESQLSLKMKNEKLFQLKESGIISESKFQELNTKLNNK